MKCKCLTRWILLGAFSLGLAFSTGCGAKAAPSSEAACEPQRARSASLLGENQQPTEDRNKDGVIDAADLVAP